MRTSFWANTIHDATSGSALTYGELMNNIETAAYYYPVFRHRYFIDFLENFLIAILNSEDIVLLDADFTDDEIEKFGFKAKFNQVHKICRRDWRQINFFEEIKCSRSRITLFTSGTTGVPKQVSHTVSSLTRLVRTGDPYTSNVWGLAYNPTHMAGLQVLFQALLNGNTLVNIFNLSIQKVTETLQEYKVTHLSGTPTFYRLLVSHKSIFNSVRRITLGGEKSDFKLYQLLQACFPNAKINNIYASTELGSLLVANGDLFKVPESLAGKVKVVDGELQVHSSLLSSPYKSEWYPTGDLVEITCMDPLTFRIASRKNEMINVGGYKVNPNEVEEIMLGLPDFIQVRVYGQPNSVLGNILCSEVVMSEGSRLDKKDVVSRLREVLQEFKIPRIIRQVERIEVTRTGKVNRK